MACSLHLTYANSSGLCIHGSMDATEGVFVATPGNRVVTNVVRYSYRLCHGWALDLELFEAVLSNVKHPGQITPFVSAP